jgi:hypothetical protein
MSCFWDDTHKNAKAKLKSSIYPPHLLAATTWQSSDAGGEKIEGDRGVSVSDFMGVLKDISEQFLNQVLILGSTPLGSLINADDYICICRAVAYSGLALTAILCIMFSRRNSKNSR